MNKCLGTAALFMLQLKRQVCTTVVEKISYYFPELSPQKLYDTSITEWDMFLSEYKWLPGVARNLLLKGIELLGATGQFSQLGEYFGA